MGASSADEVISNIRTGWSLPIHFLTSASSCFFKRGESANGIRRPYWWKLSGRKKDGICNWFFCGYHQVHILSKCWRASSTYIIQPFCSSCNRICRLLGRPSSSEPGDIAWWSHQLFAIHADGSYGLCIYLQVSSSVSTRACQLTLDKACLATLCRR